MAAAFELRDVQSSRLQQQQQPLAHNNNNNNNNNGQHWNQGQQPVVTVVQPAGPGDKLRDKYNLVFAILLIHGIGSLMPWNMFINAQDYFVNFKLQHNANDTSLTVADRADLEDLRKNFLSYLGLASQVPNVIFNAVNLLMNVGSGNLKLRVNLMLTLEGLVFAITIGLAVIDSSHWQRGFFHITMLSVVVLNMASGIYQNCIFGTGAKFPGTYTNAILIGSNLSGAFTSIVNLASIWLAPKPEVAAIYYFVTALFMILVCLISYNLLPYNRFFRFYDNEQSVAETSPIDAECRPSNSDIPESLRKTVDAITPRPGIADGPHPSQLGKSTPPTEEPFADLKFKWRVFLKCWPQCLNVFLTFYVTLAIFPAVLANVGQTGTSFSSKYFTAFACFFIFNVFAMIGNLISSLTTWPGEKNVWILVVARFIFVPYFLFCNFNPHTRTWPVLVDSDWMFILGNILLATSSGYLSSLCMMYASSGLKPEEAPKAGMLAAFFLIAGIFSGVNSSFFLTWIVERF